MQPRMGVHTARVDASVTWMFSCGQIKAKRPPWCVFLEVSLGLVGNMESRSLCALHWLALA